VEQERHPTAQLPGPQQKDFSSLVVSSSTACFKARARQWRTWRLKTIVASTVSRQPEVLL
jgi:hypothetical protein